MTHRFPVKEIARQSGLSTATIDRVLNDRPNVSAQTRRQVRDAIEELTRQEGQLAARGRRLFIDVVVEAPSRFSNAIRTALEAELPSLHPAVIRPRYMMQERMRSGDVVAILARIAKRGSQGVLLKAQDQPDIRHALSMLRNRNIPVLTIFTDIPDAGQIAYAGANNKAAGETAAYLLHHFLAGRPNKGAILITLSNERFRGEEARKEGFIAALARLAPQRQIIDASGGAGLDHDTADRVKSIIGQTANIAAVYSMGGGNRAILKTLADHGISPAIYIAHDLDAENITLLEQGKLTAVLHHDLRQDMRTACHHLMAWHGLLPHGAIAPASDIQIITPANIPAFAKEQARTFKTGLA
ncbi:LacI family DNA-binding transcriptional regulator [Thalassospira profundimaris]|uniref:LacI family DNA-binding transcriptional regulator n=1 Tax=Thalassospira profundimaris TaxID=502049 RepID=UPI000DEDD19A|nr:LacI family DNA-binding transcriptional regulator [Thalassospira profundimaris]